MLSGMISLLLVVSTPKHLWGNLLKLHCWATQKKLRDSCLKKVLLLIDSLQIFTLVSVNFDFLADIEISGHIDGCAAI